MKRRDLLGLILGACAAPAVVKADSLMKLRVPKNNIIYINSAEELVKYFGTPYWEPPAGFNLGILRCTEIDRSTLVPNTGKVYGLLYVGSIV